jgi:hypothetical protein
VDPRTIEHGKLYDNVSFADYLAWPFMSQSTLKAGKDSSAHLRAAIDGERVKKPTDDMLLGSALHTAFLEPHLMPERVVLWDNGARRGAEWEAFRADHADKIILTAENYAKLSGMIRSIRKHAWAKQIAADMGRVEVSAVDKIEGVACKGRCDILETGDGIVDVKKVRCGDLGAFTKAVMVFGYHIQSYIYRKIFNRDRFILLTVEDKPPFDVVPYELAPSMLREGEREAVSLLQNYAYCERTGLWPGRSDEVVPLELPEWAVNRDEAMSITLGGESVFGGEEEGSL